MHSNLTSKHEPRNVKQHTLRLQNHKPCKEISTR